MSIIKKTIVIVVIAITCSLLPTAFADYDQRDHDIGPAAYSQDIYITITKSNGSLWDIEDSHDNVSVSIDPPEVSAVGLECTSKTLTVLMKVTNNDYVCFYVFDSTKAYINGHEANLEHCDGNYYKASIEFPSNNTSPQILNLLQRIVKLIERVFDFVRIFK